MKMSLLILGLCLAYQDIPICRPLKEEESYVLKSETNMTIGTTKIREEGKFRYKCIDVDERDLQHIDVTCLEGTKKVDDGEAESTKGDSYNFFLNSRGQRFEYEEIRATLKDDPINFMIEEIHAKLKYASVVPGDSWKDKSAYTTYEVHVAQPKKFKDVDCLLVTRTGDFFNGMTGDFIEETWYRVSDGQLIFQRTVADHVTAKDVPEIQFFEQHEFVKDPK